MEVNNSASSMKMAIQTEMIKKSQDVVKNILGDMLEKNFENTLKIQQQAAESMQKGINLNIKG
jgi:hypothetical protein